MTQFNVPLEESDELLGDLLRISQATGAPMDNLLSQMEKWGPVFSTANFSAEETLGIFGQLEQSGVDIVAVGPKLEKFFGDVAEAGGDPRQAFEDIVEQIANASTETDALSIAAEAFGTAGSEMTSAIRDGGLELETFGGLLGDGVGLVGEQAAATETLSDKFAILKNDLMTRLGPAAAATMEAMVVAIDAVIVAIEESVKAIQRFAAWFDENLMPIITPIINLVVAWVQYMWKQIQNVVDLVVALFTGDFGGAWDALKAMATTAIDFIVETFKDLPKLLWDSITAGLGWFLSAGKMIGRKLLEGIGDALGGAVEWAAAFAKDIANALIGFINSLIDNLNKKLEIDIDMPGFLPDINLNPPDIPNIPLLAEGGIVTAPTLAVLGEAGPEAVIPLDRAGGGMGGGPMTVNIYMPVGSDGDSVVRALQEYEARNGPVPVGTRSL
jgi:hypothetical protein